MKIILGFIGACVYASLRFGDAQRCKPESIFHEDGTLRGICWKTKTSAKGQPWGCMAAGLHGNWGHTWLNALDTWTDGLDNQPYFLLPDIMVTAKSVQTLNRPMQYTRFVGWLRWVCNHTPDEELRVHGPHLISITVHSLKSTILSWATQLDTPVHLRQLQGHHRNPLGNTSVTTYSRDDVV